ncbi:HD domain-containing protein [Brachyspira innocens]|uniref:HD domain-containing protein n=1 Tax=Brachyspira innocens TaxID=13264 RepID=A0ABT8YX73_9SPIR|nr:HD domain-containing protein [Brachyspira innocens]MDO6994491.1 HD domain-containing protein [Brachyspira innocens]MDO7019947.1 HD domain-containing protein [Brachyspira innocens]
MSNDLTTKYDILTIKELKTIKDQLVSHNIPLFRVDKEKKIIPFPTEQLSLIIDNEKYSNLKLYIPKNFSVFIEEFKSITQADNSSNDSDTNQPYVFRTPKESEKEMGKRISEISKMTYKEKVSTIESYNTELKKIVVDEEVGINKHTAQQIVNVGNDVGLIAKVTMFESIQKIKGEEITQEQAKIENQEITETTTNLVTTIVDMLSKNTETQKVFDELRNYSDGGVMSHSNRVFISYVNFMAFYNNLINRRHLVHKIRTSYTNKYKKFYEQVEAMFSKDNIRKNLATVEDCIDKGIKIIEEREMNLYSVGALLHDIGKVKDLDYFEGANGRDYERIKKHLFNSYALVSQTSEYPLEVILTVALHHEYYGLGYGPYDHLYKLKLAKDPHFQIQRIMTYDAKAIDECEAFAYFPAKMLEIIDVYDALIDPARKYRGGKTFTPEEALNIMREDFVEKHVKLDPILYDVFVEFLSNSIEQDLMACKLL